MKLVSPLMATIFTVAAYLLYPVIAVGAPVPSWGSLEKSLEALEFKEFSFDEMVASEQFKELVKQNDTGLYYEMIGQSDNPLVMLAGFNAICKEFPEEGFPAAMRLLADQPVKDLWHPVYKYLDQYWSNPEHFIPNFSDALSRKWQDRGALAAVVDSVPSDLLKKWFDDKSRARSLPSNEAMVFQRLYVDCLNAHSKVPDTLQHRLEDYSQMPGYPRLTFVCYGGIADEKYKQAVTFVLEDDSLDDSLLIPTLSLCRKWEYIRDNMDIGKLKLSEQRRKQIMTQIGKINSHLQK